LYFRGILALGGLREATRKQALFLHMQAAPKLPDGPEPPRPEHVDYICLEDAKPCEDVDGCLSVRLVATARFLLLLLQASDGFKAVQDAACSILAMVYHAFILFIIENLAAGVEGWFAKPQLVGHLQGLCVVAAAHSTPSRRAEASVVRILPPVWFIVVPINHVECAGCLTYHPVLQSNHCSVTGEAYPEFEKSSEQGQPLSCCVTHPLFRVIAAIASLLALNRLTHLDTPWFLLQVAILCYGDLVQEFGDGLLPHVDGQCMPPKPSESALAQLLLKSVSKDKKFVLEASQKVLDSCAQTLDPVEMSHKLMGYLKHKCALLSCVVLYCSFYKPTSLQQGWVLQIRAGG
jgi:hypothetical protein